MNGGFLTMTFHDLWLDQMVIHQRPTLNKIQYMYIINPTNQNGFSESNAERMATTNPVSTPKWQDRTKGYCCRLW